MTSRINVQVALVCTAVVGASLVWGCAADDGGGFNPDDTGTASSTFDPIPSDTGFDDTTVSTDTTPAQGCQGIDLLFVIDDSGSMTEEQGSLVSSFPKFIEVLDTFEPAPGVHIDYRVGLTTSGVNRKFKQKILLPGFPSTATPTTTTGPDGAFVNTDTCGLSEPWLEGPDASVASEFACVGNVGVTGSSTEMPLAAMQLALGEQMAQGGKNEGFFRKDENTLLVVVLITDEDDCSVEEGGTIVSDNKTGSDCSPTNSEGLYRIEEVKAFLDDLAGGEGRYVAVAIAGPGPQSCSSTFGSAIFAQRMDAFIDLVGAYGVFGNICTGDLWTNLEEALSVIKIACAALPPK